MRSVESRQLPFAFADSPSGSGDEALAGVPVGKAFLQLIAKARKTSDPTTTAAGDTTRLLDAVAQPANLAVALLHVARNKGAAGVDGRSVDEVMADAHRLLPRLRAALLSGQYRPGDVRRVWIPKPGGGQRGLGIPNVVERWVQQAVHQILGPIFEPTFSEHSHGFRPGRGAQTAIADAKAHLEAGFTWMVSVDLSKFFDRVSHQRLVARLGQRIADVRLLRLVHRMLKAKVVLPDGTRVSTEEGTPQGGPLSPLLSNIVLDELDHELTRRGHRFVRYADDFNIFVRSERAGHRVMASTTRFIERRLRLKVNVEKSAVARPGEIHFLGFSLPVRADGVVEVDLSERSKKRMAIKIRVLTPRNWGQPIEACIERINGYLRGWFGYFRTVTRFGDRVMQAFDAHIRRRLRVIIVKQKKRPRFLYRHLIERGVRPRTAARHAWSRRGPWRQSVGAMHRAYPNAWFHRRLFCLENEWRALYAPEVEVSTGQAILPGLAMST